MLAKYILAIMIFSSMGVVAGYEEIVRHEKETNQIAYAVKITDDDVFLLYEKTRDHKYTSDIELYFEKNGVAVAVPSVFKQKTISNIGFLSLENNDSNFFFIHSNKLHIVDLDKNNRIKLESIGISDNPNEFIKKIIRTVNGLILIPDSVRDAKIFVYDLKTNTKNNLYFKEHVGRSIQEVKFIGDQVIVVSSNEKQLLLTLYIKNKSNDFKEIIRQEIHFSGYVKSINIMDNDANGKILSLSTSIVKKGLLNFLDSEDLIISNINLGSKNATTSNSILSQKEIGNGDITKQFIKCGKEYMTYSFDKNSITRNYQEKSSDVAVQLNSFPRKIFTVKSEKNQRKFLVVNFMKSIGKYFNKGFLVQKIDINCGNNTGSSDLVSSSM